MNVIMIKTTKGGDVVRSITGYATKDIASGKLFEAMTNSVADSNIVKAIGILMDDGGAVHKFEEWEAETPATEG